MGAIDCCRRDQCRANAHWWRGCAKGLGAYGELGHDGLELGWGEDACIAEVLQFGADGAEGAVDLRGVRHPELVSLRIVAVRFLGFCSWRFEVTKPRSYRRSACGEVTSKDREWPAWGT